MVGKWWVIIIIQWPSKKSLDVSSDLVTHVWLLGIYFTLFFTTPRMVGKTTHPIWLSGNANSFRRRATQKEFPPIVQCGQKLTAIHQCDVVKPIIIPFPFTHATSWIHLEAFRSPRRSEKSLFLELQYLIKYLLYITLLLLLLLVLLLLFIIIYYYYLLLYIIIIIVTFWNHSKPHLASLGSTTVEIHATAPSGSQRLCRRREHLSTRWTVRWSAPSIGFGDWNENRVGRPEWDIDGTWINIYHTPGCFFW